MLILLQLKWHGLPITCVDTLRRNLKGRGELVLMRTLTRQISPKPACALFRARVTVPSHPFVDGVTLFRFS